MITLQTAAAKKIHLRTERKPPPDVRAVQGLDHSRQGDYLAKDDVSISKQVGTRISSTGCRNKLEYVTHFEHRTAVS